MTDVLEKNQIGSILSGGGAWPPRRRRRQGVGRVDQQHPAVRAGPPAACGIPIIYGADAVHGHNNLVRRDDVPHQSGSVRRSTRRSPSSSDGPPRRAVRATGVALGLRPRARHRARPALGPLLRAVRRGPAADRHARRRHHSRPAGPRPGEPDLASPPPPSTSPATRRPTAASTAPNATIDEHRAAGPCTCRPSQQGIDAGVATVMANSGSVNGEPGARVPPPADRHPARPAALPRASSSPTGRTSRT